MPQHFFWLRFFVLLFPLLSLAVWILALRFFWLDIQPPVFLLNLSHAVIGDNLALGLNWLILHSLTPCFLFYALVHAFKNSFYQKVKIQQHRSFFILCYFLPAMFLLSLLFLFIQVSLGHYHLTTTDYIHYFAAYATLFAMLIVCLYLPLLYLFMRLHLGNENMASVFDLECFMQTLFRPLIVIMPVSLFLNLFLQFSSIQIYDWYRSAFFICLVVSLVALMLSLMKRGSDFGFALSRLLLIACYLLNYSLLTWVFVLIYIYYYLQKNKGQLSAP